MLLLPFGRFHSLLVRIHPDITSTICAHWRLLLLLHLLLEKLLLLLLLLLLSELELLLLSLLLQQLFLKLFINQPIDLSTKGL